MKKHIFTAARCDLRDVSCRLDNLSASLSAVQSEVYPSLFSGDDGKLHLSAHIGQYREKVEALSRSLEVLDLILAGLELKP